MYDANIILKVDSLGDGVCNTIPDTFQVASHSYTSVSDTFTVTRLLATLTSLNCTSTTFTSFASDLCLNNEILIEEARKSSIYPNPVKDNLTISLPNNFTASLLEVYNSIGQKVLNKEIYDSQDRELNIPISLPQGIYYGRLISGNEVLSFSFIVAQ